MALPGRAVVAAVAPAVVEEAVALLDLPLPRRRETRRVA
jgi:hypothetical protein